MYYLDDVVSNWLSDHFEDVYVRGTAPHQTARGLPSEILQEPLTQPSIIISEYIGVECNDL